jgi:hypothetical protein
MVKYVLKKGGKFLTRNGYSRSVKQAELFSTRQVARDYKNEGEKVYRVKLSLVSNSFEKVR